MNLASFITLTAVPRIAQARRGFGREQNQVMRSASRAERHPAGDAVIVRISWLKYLFSIPGLYVLYAALATHNWTCIPEAILLSVFGYLAGYGVERLVAYLTKRGAEREQK
jgi:hypothetical protein